jgi:hypothetical protein
MPPWEDILNQGQIEGLWAYLLSLPPVNKKDPRPQMSVILGLSLL